MVDVKTLWISGLAACALRHSVREGGLLLLCTLLLMGAMAGAAAPEAYGQVPGGDTLRLTAADLLARVSTASPELLRQRLEIERARAARRGVAFFPSLPELEYGIETDAPFHNEGEGGWELELTQEIEIGGQYFLRYQVADQAVRQAELEVQAVDLVLRAEARTSFARLAAAEARLRLLDTLIRFSRRLDTIAGRLLAAEEISELDRNVIRIERGSVEIERIEAEAKLLTARSELSQLLGISPGTVPTVVPGTVDAIAESAALLDTLQRVEAALAAGDESVLQRRPDWQSLDRARDRVQAERSLASRLWIPNLRVGLGYVEETSVLKGEDIVPGNEAIRSGFGELRGKERLLGLRLGIALPIPLPGLYDLGRGEIALADVELSIIEAERTRLAARIRADLARATGRLRSAARANAIYTNDIAPYVTRNILLLERGYTAGELSATEVVSQQGQFVRTGEAVIQAQQEYWEAMADFLRAVGQ